MDKNGTFSERPIVDIYCQHVLSNRFQTKCFNNLVNTLTFIQITCKISKQYDLFT